MAACDADSYGFVMEWYDKQAEIMREYQLTLFVQQGRAGPLEVAMYDPKSHRSFLKRMPVPGLALEDFYVGGTVTLHARQLKVKGYLDTRTEAAFSSKRQSFALLVVPGAFPQLGHVIDAIEKANFRICKLRLVNDNGPTVAMVVIGDNENNKWEATLNSFPSGYIRPIGENEVSQYFEDKQKFPGTAACNNCTLGIVRPHAVKAGNVGAIITSIMEAGLEISAAELLHLQRTQSEELLAVYKGVLPYQSEMVDSMTSAPCLAMELRCADGVVEKFRELCGPHDVDMAKHIRPNSLRARFGLDNPQNGVHSTDLEDDGETEVQYVFGTLLGN